MEKSTEEVKYVITYERDVMRKDIPALSAKEGEEIQRAIERKLTLRPDIFGKPLRGTLKNHWRLRVGSYRVVYRINGTTVNIFAIELRPTVYETAMKRI